MGRWNPHSGDPVINGVWPSGSYSDCDISSIVGEKVIVGFLKITRTGGATVQCAVRQKGDGDSVFNTGANAGHRGIHSVYSVGPTTHGGIIVITNTKGIFEYTGNGETGTGHMLGWFIPTLAQLRNIFDGTLPTSFTNIGSITIQNKALLFLKYLTTSASDQIAIRPDGDTDDYMINSILAGGGATCFGDHNITNLAEFGVVSSTDSKILFEQVSENSAGGPSVVDADLIAYESDNYIEINQNIVDRTALANWLGPLDLSSYIGNQESLLILKCKNYSGGSSTDIGVRPSNETNTWNVGGKNAVGKGCCTCNIGGNEAAILIVPTYNKAIDYYCDTSGSSRKTIDILGYIPYKAFAIDTITASYLSIRVNFTNPIINNSDLLDISNYYLESITNDGVGTKAISITPEEVDEPTYIDIECSDMTDNERYKLTITPSKILNIFSEYLVSNNTEYFDATSELPIIQSIKAISTTQIQIIFSKSMEYYNISDPTRYTFDKGLSVLSVTILSPGIINLLTTKQVSNEYYTLTIS